MPFIAATVAQYIRGLGYRAIPMANDTACSIPLAIDAGLGELGRNGLLIHPDFGPRIRLSKIFTDLPLVPDKPIEFGVNHYRWLDRSFLWGDKVFGYGKKHNSEKFWEI